MPDWRIAARTDAPFSSDRKRRANRHRSSLRCRYAGRGGATSVLTPSDDQPRVVPQNAVLFTKFPKGREPFLFLRAVLVTQTFLQIELAEVRAEFGFAGDQQIELPQIVVATGAERVGDRFGRLNFRPDEPERVNKRQPGPLLPFLTEIPKLKRALGFITKTNRLIADIKFREARRKRALHEPRAKNKLRREPHLGEQTAQQIDPGLRRRIDLDLF